MASPAQARKPGDFGPPLSGGRRRPPGKLDWRRIFLACIAFLGACVVMTTVTAAALVFYGEQRIRNVDVETAVPGDMNGDGTVDIAELKDIRNILIVGSDSRENLTRKERTELGIGSFGGTRTDTIMLVQLDPNRNGAAMLSFPRDLLVERCDGSEGRINSAFEIGKQSGIGGPTCLVRTVTTLTGIPIHHYAQIDFQGFVDVVDTLGGVKLYLDEPIKDEDAHVDLEAGCVTLRGADALGFVRVRKIDSDFGRIARQQRFIREMVDQVTSPSVALNVPQLFRLVGAGAKAIETDESLSLGVMRQIAFSFRDLSSKQIDSRTVPAFNRTIDGAAYVVPDPQPAEELFEAFRDGVAAPANVGKKGPVDVAIKHVPPLTVLNGTAKTGLGAAATNALEAKGFKVAATDNAQQTNVRVTQVAHPPDQREEAALLQKVFRGAVLVPDRAADGIVVTVGAEANLKALAAAKPPPEPAGPPEPEPTEDYTGASGAGKRDC